MMNTDVFLHRVLLVKMVMSVPPDLLALLYVSHLRYFMS